MTVQYATIYPAFRPAGDGLADCISMPYTLFKRFYYERICGYSLADEPKFFQTAAAVNAYYIQETTAIKDWWFKAGCAELRVGAVVEFNVDAAGKVVSLNAIREIIDKKDELIMPKGTRTVVRRISPVWTQRAIKPRDFTPGALAEFNRLYQNHRANERKQG